MIWSTGSLPERPQRVGTAEQIAERVEAHKAAGLNRLRLQMSPQEEEMERFSAQGIKPVPNNQVLDRSSTQLVRAERFITASTTRSQRPRRDRAVAACVDLSRQRNETRAALPPNLPPTKNRA
jgi:hypothetical protein